MEQENSRFTSTEVEAEAASSLPTHDGEEETEADFEGDTIQRAQDKIIFELARLKDSE